MAKNDALIKSAGFFSALGDETRLDLVKRLIDAGEMTISDIIDGLPMSRQAATRHLKVLENAGIINTKKNGRESRLTLNKKSISDAIILLENVERKWEQRLARLKMFTENAD